MDLRNAIYFILDFAGAVLRRYLMIRLLDEKLAVKDRYVNCEKWIRAGFVAVGVIFYMATGYVPFVKKLLYGMKRG